MVTKPEPATCVVGLGFIGLPTAVLIANEQMPVLGVDIKKEVVDRVNAGSLHFVEPGLESLLQRVIASKMLRASNTPEVAGVYLICVPTPTLPDHRPDLSYLDAAVTSIAPVLRRTQRSCNRWRDRQLLAQGVGVLRAFREGSLFYHQHAYRRVV
jgi:UDP-N-acetyl-D-mannosaminuronate dehydrogenase